MNTGGFLSYYILKVLPQPQLCLKQQQTLQNLLFFIFVSGPSKPNHLFSLPMITYIKDENLQQNPIMCATIFL